MKSWLFRNLLVLLIIILICIIKSPTLPVCISAVSGFMLGTFFVMYGLEEKDLEKITNMEE